MHSKAVSPKEYIERLPEDRKKVISDLRDTINKNLPKGFKEQMSYGMIGWVVPHTLYPAGYHVTPTDPLPFICVASQKNHIAVYHSAVYADPKLNEWFTSEYAKQVKTKLDMGKSCIRFKNPQHVPVDLIGKLASKITPQQWITMYENGRQSNAKK
ncbi:MAG: DUF1801 domain-containing protein [Gemmatimonadaceae bacterium]|nr:DUF1801 domain-containing protein [Chitinophagaceae bacterium]